MIDHKALKAALSSASEAVWLIGQEMFPRRERKEGEKPNEQVIALNLGRLAGALSAAANTIQEHHL
jgi:hypothetical protein